MCGLVLTMRLRRGFLPVRLWRRTLDLELRKKSRKIVRWWPRADDAPAAGIPAGPPLAENLGSGASKKKQKNC
jgi:hypothetical protein